MLEREEKKVSFGQRNKRMAGLKRLFLRVINIAAEITHA
jgi:hypothetical protein